MSVRQEAYKLIDSMPDRSVSFVISLIKNMSADFMSGAVVDESVDEKNSAIEKLNRISDLDDNWNGNGAMAFSPDHIRNVNTIVSFLSYTPEVFPTAADTIQLEFDKRDGSHLEIEIPESGMSEYYYVDAEKKDHVGAIKTEVAEINRLVRDFYESNL